MSLFLRFIIDGIITMPIALYGFLMFPDVPSTTRAFYLSEEVCGFPRHVPFKVSLTDVPQERLLSCERLEADNKDKDIEHGHLSWKLFKRVLGSWRWYGCSLLVRLFSHCP